MDIKLALNRIYSALNISNQTQLAENLGIRKASITDAKRRGIIPSNWLIKLCELYNLNPLWIKDGRFPKYIIDESVNSQEFKNENGKNIINITKSVKTIDFELLEQVIEGVENGLEEMEITLPPKVKGKIVSLLYKYFSEANKAVDSSVIKDYLKLAS